MTSALVATAAMSVGAAATTLGLHPLIPFLSYALALAVLLVAPRLGIRVDGRGPTAAARIVVGLAAVVCVLGRHLLVASSQVAPDDAFAALAVATALAPVRRPAWSALVATLAVATYVVAAATLIAIRPYGSDAVAAAHGGAELLLARRHPYADFDLVERLARFGLGPEYATPLDDGTRLRSLNYPALTILVPAPFIALGLADVRAVYLLEVLLLFGLVVRSVAPRWRAFALALCIGNLVILDQFVVAGIDPLWALLIVGAWLLRSRRASAVVMGLALATRQPAWLIAPFLIAWAWRERGRSEALTRASIAFAVAVVIHVPFLVGAPTAVIGGITDPALRSLEAWGVGPAKLAADRIGPLLPRFAYVVAAAAAYVAALWAYASSPARDRAALVWPLIPLWLSYRALQSYFAFLPLFAATEEDG